MTVFATSQLGEFGISECPKAISVRVKNCSVSPSERNGLNGFCRPLLIFPIEELNFIATIAGRHGYLTVREQARAVGVSGFGQEQTLLRLAIDQCDSTRG